MSHFERADEANASHALVLPSGCETLIPQTYPFLFLRVEQKDETLPEPPQEQPATDHTKPHIPISSNGTSRLLSLPPEILLEIIPMLPYPDALALKHTHSTFYNMIDTSVRLKVAWLLDRKVRGLPTPEKMCCLKSDGEFCNGGLVGGWPKGKKRGKDKDGGGEVSRIMARRRRHGECENGRCEVLVGRKCGGQMELDLLKSDGVALQEWARWGSHFVRYSWLWLLSVLPVFVFVRRRFWELVVLSVRYPGFFVVKLSIVVGLMGLWLAFAATSLGQA